MVYEEIERTRQTQLTAFPLDSIQPVLKRIQEIAQGY